MFSHYPILGIIACHSFQQELARHTLDRLRGRVVSFEEEVRGLQLLWSQGQYFGISQMTNPKL